MSNPISDYFSTTCTLSSTNTNTHSISSFITPCFIHTHAKSSSISFSSTIVPYSDFSALLTSLSSYLTPLLATLMTLVLQYPPGTLFLESLLVD